MRVPTIGGLKQIVSKFRVNGAPPEKVESDLKTFGDQFQWSDNTLLSKARSQLKAEASDRRTLGFGLGVTGAFMTAVGVGLAAMSAPISGLAALAIGSGVVAVGGVGLLAASVQKFSQAGKYSSAARDIGAYGKAERSEAPAAVPQGLTGEAKKQAQMKRVVQRVQFSAQRALDRMDRNGSSEPTNLVLKNEKKTEDFGLSWACDRYFDAEGKIEDHQLTSFRTAVKNPHTSRTELSFEKTSQGTLYSIVSPRATSHVLEGPGGRLIQVEDPKQFLG